MGDGQGSRESKGGQLKKQSDLWLCEGEIDGCLTSGLLKMAEQPFMVQERK